MAHNLKAIERTFGKIDALVINNGRANEVIIPLQFVNDVYMANQRLGGSRDEGYMLFDNLMVRIANGEKRQHFYASIKTRWLEDEKVWIITSLYNSHGLYNYADLKG